MAEPTVAVFHRRTLRNRLATWFAATRPAFLTASVLPVLVGIAWSWRQSGGEISTAAAFLALFGIIFIHAGANVVNDYFDSRNGTDPANKARVFPFTGGSRFIQNEVLSERETGRFGALLLAIGGAIGLILVIQGGLPLLLIGLAGGLTAIFYSAPPCLACRGMGDLAIATSFGLLPVAGTVLLLSGSVPPEAWWLGAIAGFYVAGILWINSIPDIEADQQAGKRTWPVRLGATRASRWLALFFILPALIVLFAPLPAGVKLTLLSIVPAALAVRKAIDGKLTEAIPLTLMTHALGCVSMIVGLVWL